MELLTRYSITFDEPMWLVLLAVAIPAIWLMGWRSLGGLGRGRWLMATGLRTVVATLLILALAGAQANRQSDSVAVAYLLDQSDSIPPEHRSQMLEFVRESVQRHRRETEGDRVAVVVFGRNAAIEYPPTEFAPDRNRLEMVVDASGTNLAEALRTAVAVLPSDFARRLVVVSDGNETIDRAITEATAISDLGVAIDVVPAPVHHGSDVLVENLTLPGAVSKDQPFELRVVLANRGSNPQPATGQLRVTRKAAGVETTVTDSAITLPPGKSVFTVYETLDASDFYVYEARFLPDEAASDRFSRNNLATGFVDIRGRGRVLVIEDAQQTGEVAHLQGILKKAGLDVDVHPASRTFTSLAELQRYDVVVLANLARTSDSQDDNFVSLTDSQVDMLVRNTKELGCGLVMLGGRRSFGAGGWADTPLEEAMPVDFRIKNSKIIPVGALALVIDKSGSMSGPNMQLSLAAARAAIGMLGPRDYITVVAFDSGAYEVVPLQRVDDGQRALRMLSRVGAGGGTDLYPGMEKGFTALRRADASVKHMIVLTDGQTPPAAHAQLAAQMQSERITVSGVAVGPGADRRLVAQIASQGGGKFYAVNSAKAVPQIFMHETRRVAMPVIRELKPPRAPVQLLSHEMLSGISGAYPPLGGFVQTTVKSSPLVEVLLRSPVPAVKDNATILATWQYGLGKATALTTDAGQEWAHAWTGWEHYDRLYEQIVRWSMRPVGEDSRFALSAANENEQARIVIDAIDQEDEFVNSLGMVGQVVGPDLESVPITIQQTAPGRYVGQFDTKQAGSYFVTVVPLGGGAPLRMGVNVAQPKEYESFSVNLPLLETLAATTPHEVPPGQVAMVEQSLPFETTAGNEAAHQIDPFRRDLPAVVRSRDVWPLLVVAACCLFVSDVLVRRVDLGGIAVMALAALKRRQKDSSEPDMMTRLQSRKQLVREELSRTRANFPTPTIDSPSAEPSPLDTTPVAAEAKPRAAASVETKETEEDSYTSRLLAAKRSALRRDSSDPPERN